MGEGSSEQREKETKKRGGGEVEESHLLSLIFGEMFPW